MCTYWKNKTELKSYVSIETPEGLSYGGSQKWLPSGEKSRRGSVLSRYGCGLVAMGDFFLMAGRVRPELRPSLENGCFDPATRDKKSKQALKQGRYLAYLRSLNRRYLAILPHIGANAWQIWYAFWRYQRRSGGASSGHWGVWPWKRKQAILEMLGKGLPVVFCIGPNVNPFRREEKVTLYRLEGEKLVSHCRITGHYVNITGWCEDQKGEEYLQVSSWGRRFYLSWREFCRYEKSQPPILGSWLSNLLYVR